MSGIRGAIQLGVLALVGLGAGVWTVVAPWVVGYPLTANNGWTPSAWSNVWVGGIVAAVSALGLVTSAALAISAALRRRPEGVRP
ncbi:MAG: hypothetical protein M3024_02145 [Candidatus Dormibacteraeota bacterium]|nr:hypothetical protein [Candidatus Dormibacteraeota bacterium]